MVAHKPKSNTMFEAFSDYNGPRKPAIKKMNRLSIVDASARVAKISGGTPRAALYLRGIIDHPITAVPQIR